MPSIYQTSIYAETIWGGWIENQTAATNASINRVWYNWADQLSYRTTGSSIIIQQTSVSATTTSIIWTEWAERKQHNVRVSKEERARRDEESRRWQEQRDEAAKARAEANSKAEKLLHSCLSLEQKEDLEKKGCFYLHVADKKYRVRRGQVGNIELVDVADKALHRYCIHPVSQVPDADAMLAQKLLLETNEAEFLRIANMHF